MSRSPRWGGRAGAAERALGLALALVLALLAGEVHADTDTAATPVTPAASAPPTATGAPPTATAARASTATPAAEPVSGSPASLEEPPLPASVEDGIQFTWKLIQLAAILAGMSGLGFLAVRVLGPRFSPLLARQGDLIKVVDQKRLDAKTTLYVVEVGGKHALIAVGDGEVRALSELRLDDEKLRAAAAAKAAERGAGGGFADILLAGRKRPQDAVQPAAKTGATDEE